MLPFGVTVPVTVPQRSEIPEGLMNYPACGKVQIFGKALTNHSSGTKKTREE
jgi:hypothetical protein